MASTARLSRIEQRMGLVQAELDAATDDVARQRAKDRLSRLGELRDATVIPQPKGSKKSKAQTQAK